LIEGFFTVSATCAITASLLSPGSSRKFTVAFARPGNPLSSTFGRRPGAGGRMQRNGATNLTFVESSARRSPRPRAA
jgi:hypothetical protein